ncbi:P-loop containing nucleoside triphosphate hydrolase protein [Mycena sanguinolenta]|nr:P-loop containing nucleoside triphosphate hydrolase protein [Mycena sanguinolenta]
MSDQPFTIVQDIFTAPHPAILVTSCPLTSLTQTILEDILDSGEGILGVAPAYGTNCVLSILAFATATKVLLVRCTTGNSKKTSRAKGKAEAKAKRCTERGRVSLEDLLSASHPKFAFNMDVLATSLHFDLGLRIRSGVDLLSGSRKDARRSLQALMVSLGEEIQLNKANVKSLFKGDEKWNRTTPNEVALQAWVAWRAATVDGMTLRLNSIPRIDTSSFLETHLSVFAKMVRDMQRLSALKPTVTRNDISKDYSAKKDQVDLNSARFKTRIQGDSVSSSVPQEKYVPNLLQRPVKIDFKHGGQYKSIFSRLANVQGRAVKLNLEKALPSGGSITRVTTIGRDPLTSAEAQSASTILKALQRTSDIADKPFFQAIWLPQEMPNWPTIFPFARSIPIRFSRPLNDSQKRAVSAIVSDAPINVIHGPPGSGKTTVIAAAVASLSASGISARNKSIWLVAQSNVAVKNIAEKLAAVDFLDFKVIVSREFHFDWHEHLYEKINPNLILSDQLTNDAVATDRLLLGSKVILCTLSMLSNQRISTVTRLVPIQTVIVDEASQVDSSSAHCLVTCANIIIEIQLGDFLPMISLFSTTLRKLVFIGDDKQCGSFFPGSYNSRTDELGAVAPYGQGEVQTLQSVFEMKHLREKAIFLNTQCLIKFMLRKPASMPTQLGTFISKRVYNNMLRTVHPDNSQCCRFVDVERGKETSAGSSWINNAEIRAAIRTARECEYAGRSYRIITPYDAQRGRIEAALKSEKPPLAWQDKVFCIDSFQGNEDDYIVLSVVRTEKIGFLAEARRVNVMLTRCKKGMVILTSRAFVEGVAKCTLIGLLASDIGPGAWVN